MISEADLLFELSIADIILKLVDDVDHVNQLHGGYTRSDLQGRTQVVAKLIIEAVTEHVQRMQQES